MNAPKITKSASKKLASKKLVSTKPASKKLGSKKLASTKSASKKLASQKATRWITSTIAHAPREYVLPGGVALGACLLAATGLLLRKPLKAAVRLAVTTAMHEGMTAMKMLEGSRVLEKVASRRRRPPIGAIAGASLGAVAAGSALAFWLAPNRAIPSLGQSNGATSKSTSGPFDSATSAVGAL